MSAATDRPFLMPWEDVPNLRAFLRARGVPDASAASIRSGIERGDPFAVVRDRPVGSGVDAGQRIRAANWPTLAAVTDEAVADDLDGADLQLGVVVAVADGQDADAMEHPVILYPSDWIATTDGPVWHVPPDCPRLVLPRLSAWTRDELDAEYERQRRLARWHRQP